MNPAISASILAADVACLGDEVDHVLLAGASRVHLDVMDHHYVPNLTFGPLVCEGLRRHGIEAPIDVHLMAKPVDALIREFAAAGATSITFHPEATDHVDRSLSLIRELDCQCGLAFNPATSLDLCQQLASRLDAILLMSVNPGFGGQVFIDYVLDKVREARQIIDASRYAIRLEVDGGIKEDNIADVAKAGADTFVIGSGIFGCHQIKDPNRYDTVISALSERLREIDP